MQPEIADKIKNRFPDLGKDSVKIFLFLMVVFGIFAHTIGDNENSRLDTTISIVEDGTVSIDRIHNNTGDKALVDGSYYSDKAPLSSLLAVPSYLLVDSQFGDPMEDKSYLESFRRSHSPKMEWARFAATVSVSAAAGAATSVLIYLLSLKFGLRKNRALLVSLISGLTTLVFPYSTTLHGTMLGTFLLVTAVFIWVKNDYRTSGKNTDLVGLFIGLGISSSYLVAIPGALLMFLNSVNRLEEFQTHLKMVAGLLAGLTPLFIFNYLATGNPVEPTFLHTVNPMETTEASGYLFEFSIARVVGARLIRTLFSPLNGLFLYSPILLFGVIGLRRLYRKERKLFWFVSGSFLLTLLAVSFIALWSIRAFYGPRYVLPASTLLLVPLILELKKSGKLERGLIYISALFSGAVMFASTQPWLGSSWVNPKGTHLQQMVSPGIYQNRLLTYLQKAGSEAFQSPIISYLTGSSTDFHMVLSSYPQYSFPVEIAGELLTYDSRMLAAIIVIAAGFLLFREYLDSRNNLIAGGALVLVLVISGISTPSYYMHDWYDEKPSENVQWGREQPEIYFGSEKSMDKVLEMEARTYGSQNVSIILNGEPVRDVGFNSNEIKIVEAVKIREGLNQLSFQTDRCRVIGRFSRNDDTRCVTLGLKDYNLTTIQDGYLFDRMEKTPEGHRSVTQNSQLLVNMSGRYSLELETSSSEPTELGIVSGEKKVSHSRVDRFPSTVKTPYLELGGLTKLGIQKSCQDCDLTVRDIKFKEYSQQNETFRKSANWYQKIDAEERTWTPGNATVLIYNFENRSVEKELNIQGRSFHRPKNISFVLNSQLLGTREVPTTAYRILENGTRIDNRFSFKVDLQPGENVLELNMNESCSVIGKVNGNDDVRCASYGLRDIWLDN